MNSVNVWLPDAQGGYVVEPVSPCAWRGQQDCVIGPFSSREAAKNFLSLNVDFCSLGVTAETIFPKGDAWYVQLSSRDDSLKATEQVLFWGKNT